MHWRRVSAVLAVAALATLWRPSEAEPARPETTSGHTARARQQYNVYRWTSAHGLPASTIQCLLQTRDGYLWVGTRDALARFDGERFVRVKNLNCLSLAEDSDAALWIGTASGLFRWSKGDFTEIPLPIPPNPHDYDRSVHSLCASTSGGVWAGCGLGVVRIQGKAAIPLPDGPQLRPIWSIGEFDTNKLMISSSEGMESCLLAADKHEAQRTIILAGESRALARDNDRNVWFGLQNKVFRIQKDQLSLYPSDVGEWDTIFSMAIDQQNTVWVGSRLGLYQLHDGHFVRPAGLDAESLGPVNCMVCDREGNLFLGTESQGLVCLQPKRFVTWSRSDGLVNDDVWSICASRDGSVWIGTEWGLSHFAQGRWESYGTERGLLTDRVRSLFEDSTGALWVGTDSANLTSAPGGLHRFENGVFHAFGPQTGIASRDISSICEGADGSVWIIGGAGLHNWSKGILHTYTPPDGLPYGCRYVFADHHGNLWLGGQELSCWRERKAISFDLKGKLGNALYAVAHEDENGALWLVSSSKGLIRFKNADFRAVTTAQGLFSDLILSMQEDGDGNYWMNCHTGIFRAAKKDLNAVADGRQPSLQCVVYGLEDGLLSAEGNGGTLPNSCKSADGRLWFPTTKGVAVVDPAQTRLDAVPPCVVLETFRADGEVLFQNLPSTTDQKRSDAVRVPDDSNQSMLARRVGGEPRDWLKLLPGRGRSLEFSFTATSLIHSDRVRFHYRLEGRDRDWLEIGTQRFVSFQDLPPGRYVFRVSACNHHGVWNETGQAMAFELTPFFYQTWPFYGLCVFAVALGFSALLTFRLAFQRRILRLQHLAALAGERERIARDMHDDLGASLTKIALLSEVARKQLAEQHPAVTPLEHVSAIARHVVDGMSELIWVTNPQFDTLPNLVAYLREYAARSFATTPIDCRLDFPVDIPDRQLPADFRRQIFLVLKEAINNIQKHSSAKRAGLCLGVSDGQLELTVSDDGRGFLPDDVRQSSHGLANMRQRVQSLGGSMLTQSHPGGGTTHRFVIPLPQEPG